MSLSALVRHPSRVRDRMAADFPRPRLRLRADLLVPSVAPNRALMGTAYDYLLRFHLLRATPFAVCEQWVAEGALGLVSRLSDKGAMILVGDKLQKAAVVRDQMQRVVGRARRLLADFLAGEQLSVSLIRAAINLAHCDTYYRIGRLDHQFVNPHPAQTRELRRLIDVTDLPSLTATRVCLLNPTFGEGSRMLGGADADLLIDDLLIDVKTTATLKIRTEDWRQLIGYAALNEHFPIGGGKRRRPVRRLGFYFSRYGYLASWPVEQLVDVAKFTVFAAWLRDYALDTHARRVARRLAARAERARQMAEWQEIQRERKAKQHPRVPLSRRKGMQTAVPRSSKSARSKRAGGRNR